MPSNTTSSSASKEEIPRKKRKVKKSGTPFKQEYGSEENELQLMIDDAEQERKLD